MIYIPSTTNPDFWKPWNDDCDCDDRCQKCGKRKKKRIECDWPISINKLPAYWRVK